VSPSAIAWRTEVNLVGTTELNALYRRYIACLNAKSWPDLGRFIHDDVEHNGRPLGLTGYRAMLENDYRQIPDLRFTITSMVCEPPHVAVRLSFDCAPAGEFLGLPVNGKRVRFTEHVFYALEGGRIRTVWSLLDRQAIEAQLSSP
jgi:predicted ester cyclase